MKTIMELNHDEAAYAAEHISRMGNNLQLIYHGCLERVSNALFLINGGGIVTTLAYMYRTECPNHVNILLWMYTLCSFIFGLLLAFSYTAMDFWLVRNRLMRFSEDVSEFFSNKLPFMKINLFDPDKKKASLCPLILGFGSCVFSFIGIAQGIMTFIITQNINTG